MTILSAAERSQIYTEFSEATSSRTAEVLMRSIVDAPWDNLVTRDHLDARVSQIDATLERSLRKQTVWLVSAMFAFNGLLAAWLTAFH